MHDFILASSGDAFSWPLIGVILAASGGWECYTGQVRFGRYIEIDRDESIGPYVIIVGLKFVAALLIMITTYFGVS